MAHYSGRASRRHSLNIPGHAHELTFSCYRRFPFLSEDRCRNWFGRAISEAALAHDFAIWAYVVMPEHVHLILWPRKADYDMSAILKSIKEPVGRRGIAWLAKHAPDCLPRITRTRGKRVERLFWQSGGGYDRNIDNYETLELMIDYIHANPVRRNLVAHPCDWLWSSAKWHLRREPGPIPIDPIV